MSFNRTSAGVLFFVVGGVVGCTAYPTLKSVAPDCTVEEQYDFDSIETFDTADGGVGTANLWTATDTLNAGVYTSVAIASAEAIPGGRCLSKASLVMRSSRNNDWGSLFGFNNFARSATGYEGLSFWAKAPGATTKGFTILLNDQNTVCLGNAVDGGACDMPANCITYGSDGGTGMTMYDSTGMAIPGTGGAPPAPDACGNAYQVTVLATVDWQLYTIPFSQFQQGATPNRVPNAKLMQTGPVPGTALLIDDLSSLTFRMPKEAVMELWLDDLAFYRRRGAGTGGDGGVDAPQM
jgi:hypothetical protein